MKSELPFRLDDLLHQRSIEGNRIEFKATWNDVIANEVTRTACAFANDLLNLNGGYIILGVEEQAGRAILPPRGLGDKDLDRLQKKIHEACRKIEPAYLPLIFHEHHEDRPLLILWCPGGDNRPYRAPDGNEKAYLIRHGSLTVRATGDLFRQLLELTAKIPFDDRRALSAQVEDLSPTLVRRFLHQVGSRLIEQTGDDRDLYRRIAIVAPVNSHEVPRNIGLLFFHEDPDRFFPGARIELALFADDTGGELLEERVFRGPLYEQVQDVLRFLKSSSGELVQKRPGDIKAQRYFPYPEHAIREALVNAVYHRAYDAPPEPIKVYVYSDRLEITSYPGPIAGIRPDHFLPGSEFPSVPARNRRVGDFLKELGLAEKRGTGVQHIQDSMAEIGAPPAGFDFDTTYFRTRLYVPAIYGFYVGTRLWEAGKERQAVAHWWRVYQRQPTVVFAMAGSSIPRMLIGRAWEIGQEPIARAVFALYEASVPEREREPGPLLAMAHGLLGQERKDEALVLLRRLPMEYEWPEPLAEAASSLRRAGDPARAYQVLEAGYQRHRDHPSVLFEYGCQKCWMAHNWYQGQRAEREQLLAEAAELFHRALALHHVSPDPDIKSAHLMALAETAAELQVEWPAPRTRSSSP